MLPDQASLRGQLAVLRAYGAALLAGVGTGIWASVDEACDQAVTLGSRTDPNPEHSELLDRQYARYRALYPALKQIIDS